MSISRRQFIKTSLSGAAAVSAYASTARAAASTRYIAAYDTETPACLAACRKIVEVHQRFEMPATFFIVGETLADDREEYRGLLDDPLFEIASHSYSHKMLRDNPFCGPAVSLPEKQEQIGRGKAIVEEVFGRQCTGLRPGCGFAQGFKGDPEVLGLIAKAGYQYVSSILWDRDFSLPAPLREPFNYAADGFPRLWELPGHGWHENLLKDNNNFGPRRLTLWPPAMPEAIPAGFLTKPEQEFEINRLFLRKALDTKQSFVSLIWHPWSMDAFDPAMKMLELTFEYVRKSSLRPSTYQQLHASLHEKV